MRSAPGALTARGEEKRRAILDAAAHVLARRGYAEATLHEIASMVGTHAGSLYYYFDSREDLVRTVLLRATDIVFDHTRRAVDALGAEATPLERLCRALEAHVESIFHEDEYALAAQRSSAQLPPVIHEPLLAHNRAYGQYLADLFTAAAEDGQLAPDLDLSALRLLLVGAANATVEWFRPDGPLTVPELAKLLTRVALYGATAPPPGDGPGTAESTVD